MMPKFRAWDKYEEAMTDQQGIYFGAMDHDETLESLLLCLEERYELMQSTGLKDKNEVEIFEGDIVRCTVDNWSNGEKFEQIDKVVYEDCMFTFSDGYKYDCSIAEPTYLSKEVLGNIYENPDLLEAE